MIARLPLPAWDALHPLAVHFPIVLLTVAPLFVVLALSWRRQAKVLLSVACILVLLGVASAFLATATGEAAERLAGSVPGAGAVLHRHEERSELARNLFAGLAVALLLATVAFWRVGERASRTLVLGAGGAYLLMHGAASWVLLDAAHEGGKLVHAIGVRAWAPSSPSRPEGPPGIPMARRDVPTLIAPPPPDANRPVDLPGVRNVVAFTGEIYSGATPEGDAGFDSLQAMGIRTLLSVAAAAPDVGRAASRGMRCVHIPVGHDGTNEKRRMEIARAVHDLPRPVFIHCPRGRDRSAAAAGAASVVLGHLGPAEAARRMRVSGTSSSYKGLYRWVATAKAATAAQMGLASGDFPEIVRPVGLVDAMVEIEKVSDDLAYARTAGWRPPKDHPDLVPAEEAVRLAGLLGGLREDERVKVEPPEFQKLLLRNRLEAEALATGLSDGKASPEELDRRFDAVITSCKECHAEFGD